MIVLYLVTSGTIEEKVMAAANQKLDAEALVIQVPRTLSRANTRYTHSSRQRDLGPHAPKGGGP